MVVIIVSLRGTPYAVVPCASRYDADVVREKLRATVPSHDVAFTITDTDDPDTVQRRLSELTQEKTQ